MPVRKSSRKELLGFSVLQRYRVPLKKVWETATQAKHLNGFFTHGAKGNITPKMEPVTWRWKNYGSAAVQVTACDPGKSFEFLWATPVGYQTKVRFEFSREKGKTVVRIR